MLTKEKIICIRAESTNPEYLQQIKELAMNVSHNGNWGFDVNHVALLHQELLRLGANSLDNRLGKQLFPVKP